MKIFVTKHFSFDGNVLVFNTNQFKPEMTKDQKDVVAVLAQAGIEAKWNDAESILYIETDNEYIKFHFTFNPAALMFGANPCVTVKDVNLSEDLKKEAKNTFRGKAFYKKIRAIVASFDVWEPGCVAIVESKNASYWLDLLDNPKLDIKYRHAVSDAYQKIRAGEDFSEYEAAVLNYAIKKINSTEKISREIF